MTERYKRGHTVEKIGGTSMADSKAVLENVFLGPSHRDAPYNRIFVVSAYAGVTNKLLEEKKSGAPGVYAMFASADSDWGWGELLSEVDAAMCGINRDIFGDAPECKIADTFVRERIEGVRSCLIDLHRLCSFGQFHLNEHLSTVREMLSALGEAHSAHNTMLLLRARGVNAAFVDVTGWRDDRQPTLDERLKEALADIDLEATLPILPGYAHCREGMVQSFGRGYTEVTFSRAAVLTGAREAIIHKEFHLSSADPKIAGAENVRKIGRTNYDVADQLSNMGMEAVHPRAAKGLRQAEIPLRVKNTFDPEDAGTEIRGDYVSKTPGVEIVTGRQGVVALEFFEQDMVGVKGYDADILDALTRHRISIVAKSSNANTITHYLAGSLKLVRRAIADLENKHPAAEISVRKVAIVSVIGSDLRLPKLTAAAAGALADADIDILGLHQLMRNVDIQFVIDESRYEDGVRELHRALVEQAGEGGGVRPASQRAA